MVEVLFSLLLIVILLALGWVCLFLKQVGVTDEDGAVITVLPTYDGPCPYCGHHITMLEAK